MRGFVFLGGRKWRAIVSREPGVFFLCLPKKFRDWVAFWDSAEATFLGFFLGVLTFFRDLDPFLPVSWRCS
jgi:hypothetical protein